jgi:GNAT superfamily N-acetyltransferase
MAQPDALDNAVWWSLTGRHHVHAEVFGRARRYRSDVSVFAAVDRFDPESWRDLAVLAGPSRLCTLFCADIPATLPAGWIVRARGLGRQMVVDADTLHPVDHVAARRLTVEDVPQMLELVAATKPGPFRPGTIALGHYYGHFDGARLVAMIGERLCPEDYTEISAVCTHPDTQGRGLASALTHYVASQIFTRGEQPFLHVADSNERGRLVYQRLGFRERRLIDFALVAAPD